MSTTAILLTTLIYLLLLYAVAALSARRADNETFFTGGRRNRWWIVALSMIGAPMSGVSFVSVPGSVAASGFSYMQMVAGFTVGQIVIALWLVPLFYRLRVTSLYEYLEGRFGPETHRAGAIIFLLSKGILTALKLYVVVMMMEQLLFTKWGVPFWVGSLVMVIAVWGFTRRGGVRSVVWSDILQTLFLVGAVVGTALILVRELLPVHPDLWREAASFARENTILRGEPQSPRTFWKMFVGGIFTLIAMTGLDQEMMQRNLSCPTPRDAQRNILLTALAQIVVIALLLLLGYLLHRFAMTGAVTMPETSDALFGLVATQGGLPLGVGVLFLLGLLSSTFSTAGSALTALTTSSIYDLFPRLTHSSETLARARHRIHLLLALGVWLLILLFHHSAHEQLIDLLFRIVGYTYGPLLGLFLFGELTHRQVQGRWLIVPLVAAPLLSYAGQELIALHMGFQIGHELILYNAILTMCGLYIISKKQ